MVVRNKDGGLSDEEKAIVKTLLERNWRNQDLQAMINHGRHTTVNSGRITGVKADLSQKKASDESVERFLKIKRSYEAKTGLNPYLHERLMRSREAMLLAVSIFNNPTLKFRAEVFCVLSNIAWTYLLHEYFVNWPPFRPDTRA